MASFVQATTANPLVLAIPLVAGVVGWLTNVLALKMTFHPVNFVGVKPFGWQGVVPANSVKLARSFIQLLSEKLISVDDIFAGDVLDEDIEPVVKRVTDEVMNEVATSLAPENWARAGEPLRQYITELVHKTTGKVVRDILAAFRDEAAELIDFEEVVLDAVREDAGLIGHLLVGVAGPEMKFIERSGFWFGLLFGVLQMLLWVAHPAWWILPAGGFLVGYITNFLALRLVFEPHEPVQFGPLRIQGMLHKRKDDVARRFAEIMADDILSPKHMLRTLAEGQRSGRLVGLVEAQVERVFDVYAADPMTGMLIADERLATARTDLLERVRTQKPQEGGIVQSFVASFVKLRSQMEHKLVALDPKTFEGVLRPAFQEDEWKLFVTGAVLGALAGTAQLFVLFGGG